MRPPGDVTFLLGSENRMAVLVAFEDGPQTRRELERSTGVPRATLGRVLGDFRRRDLVARRDGRYDVTPLGEFFVVRLGSFDSRAGVSLETVTFLMRSENRLAVLETLTSGPFPRRELEERTGVPRATLGRILADLRRHDLAMREDGDYTATPSGERLVAELRSLFESTETMEKLQTVARWLPLDDADFDLVDLATGEVVTPTATDPLAPVTRGVAELSASERVRALSASAIPETLEAGRRAVAGSPTVEVVVTPDVVDALAVDPAVMTWSREQDPSGELFVYDGDLPHDLVVVDGTVHLYVIDDGGAIRALVTSDEEAVRSWAEATVEAYRRAGEPVDAERLRRTRRPSERAGVVRQSAEEMEMIRRVYEEAWGGEWDLDLIDDYVGTDFVRHIPYKPDMHSAAEYKAHIASFREAFPDAEATVEEIVPLGDRYVFRWRARGTHVGEFAGIEPSGERVEFSGLSMARFEDGRCVEEWSFAGLMGLVE